MAMGSILEVAPNILFKVYMSGSRISPSCLRAQYLKVTRQGLIPRDGPDIPGIA